MNDALDKLLGKEEFILNMVGDTTSEQAILIEIVYKNGIIKEFWCKEFKIDSGMFYWVSVSGVQRPLYLNVDDVSSVWVKDVTMITIDDYNNCPKALYAYKDSFEVNK